MREFLKRKNIEISAKRYGIDALGAMAQGLFCSLLIGTILDTLGKQLGIAFLVTVGGYASAMSGSAMAPNASTPYRFAERTIFFRLRNALHAPIFPSLLYTCHDT